MAAKEEKLTAPLPEPPLAMVERHIALEKPTGAGSLLRQMILGGQDGLVNVLGLILGVASATNSTSTVIIAGLAGTFAESISMAAVAYASGRAAQDYYNAQVEKEKKEIKDLPDIEREEVKLIYMKKGLRGKELDAVVNKICSDEKVWLDVMMKEELGLTESESIEPVKEGVIVGVSSLVGSLIPLVPFFFFPVSFSMPLAFVISVAVLFAAGALKAKWTIGDWLRSGSEMAAIGTLAAVSGYVIGTLLGATVT